MAIEVKLPNLGDGVDSGDVLELLVKEGDVIEKEQGILELETDKATAEVPSTHAGKVTKIHVGEGDTVEVGATLITLEAVEAEADGEEESGGEAATQAEPKAPAKEKEAKKKEPKDEAEQEQEEAEEDVAEEKPAKEKPKAKEKQEEQEQPAAKEKGETEVARKAAPPKEQATAVAEEDGEPSGEDGAIAAGPAVRRFAREVGVDLRRVQGTGEGGRITRDDVLQVVRHASQAAKTGRKGKTEGGETSTDAWGPIRVERMTKIRKTIARKMHESWTAVSRVTNFDDADVTDLEAFRQASKGDYADRGIKLTSMPFVIKAVAMALRNNPTLNATIDTENDQIIYKEYVNVGIAVDTERGLVVPALRGADKLSIPEIATELANLSEKVRNGSFSVEDLRGGTFTISNLGAIGGTYSTPIVNVPEVAILLLGRTRKLPVVVNDQVVPRLMMPLSLSYDHRLVDGATAARFLNDVIGYLRAPSRLLLAP